MKPPTGDRGFPNPEMDSSLLALFGREAEAQIARVLEILLALEQAPQDLERLHDLMRELHSLKGAARVVGLTPVVHLAHGMEDCLARIREHRLRVTPDEVDVLMRAADRILSLARRAATGAWDAGQSPATEDRTILLQLRALAEGNADHGPGSKTPQTADPAPDQLPHALTAGSLPSASSAGPGAPAGRSERLDRDRADELMRLAAQALADVRWLNLFLERMANLQARHQQAGALMESLGRRPPAESAAAETGAWLDRLQEHWRTCAGELHGIAESLRTYEQKTARWSHRLYLTVLESRIRPFGEAVRRLPRLVRDLARSSGKEVRLEVAGEETRVDRSVLERLEHVLMHLVRNAVDHGCETPVERIHAGKPARAVVRVEACLRPHELLVRVADDGRGVDLAALRKRVSEWGRVSPQDLETLSPDRLLEFLFQPGLTLRSSVTSDSGRGIGLDVVRQAVREMRGQVFVETVPGRGTTFVLHLPLTLSVVRAIVVEVSGQAYAFPVAQVRRVLRLERVEWSAPGGQPVVRFAGQPVPLRALQEGLGLHQGWSGPPPWWVVVTGEGSHACAWQVDHCPGEQELTLQPVETDLWGLKHASGVAVLEDGRPVLVLSAPDLVETLRAEVQPNSPHGEAVPRPAPVRQPAHEKRRVLVADGSAQERDRIRRALADRGYESDEAQDGWEAWRAIGRQDYALVLAAVGMAGLDGVELTRRLRRHRQWFRLPVLLLNRGPGCGISAVGYEVGANGCLEGEALDPGTVAREVERVLGRS